MKRTDRELATPLVTIEAGKIRAVTIELWLLDILPVIAGPAADADRIEFVVTGQVGGRAQP